MDKNHEHWDDWMAIMGHAVYYMGRDILSENALTGPAQLYEAINDPTRAGKNFVPNAIASALVPFSTFQSQVSQRFIDPIMRQTSTPETYDKIMETVQSRTPFLSRDLMPKVDIFGKPMQRDYDPNWAQSDPVMMALQHLQIFPTQVESRLWGVPLNEKQFADYATIAGNLFYNQVSGPASNPDWVRLSDKAQADIIMSAIKSSRAQARATMSLYYPDLVKESAQKKLDTVNHFSSAPPE